MLVLATRDDALVPFADVRRTAAHYDAELRTFPGTGLDLMLDADWSTVHRHDQWVEDVLAG